MKSKLQEAVKVAMKEKNRVKVETLRSVLSAIQYEEMQKKKDALSDDESLEVLRRELKKRKEEQEFAEKAKREDLLEKLKMEMASIEAFLPKQLGREELLEIIRGYKASEPEADMGAIMRKLKESHAGHYDPRLASELAKSA